MTEKLHKVRIKPGCTHGAQRQHKAGSVIEVTQNELDAFGDKFIVLDRAAADPVGVVETVVTTVETETGDQPDQTADDTPAFDLKTAKMDDVLAAVEAGIVTVDDVLTAEEKRSRPRKSLIAALTGGE